MTHRYIIIMITRYWKDQYWSCTILPSLLFSYCNVHVENSRTKKKKNSRIFCLKMSGKYFQMRSNYIRKSLQAAGCRINSCLITPCGTVELLLLDSWADITPRPRFIWVISDSMIQHTSLRLTLYNVSLGLENMWT